jgi:bla regulator protein blaR1
MTPLRYLVPLAALVTAGWAQPPAVFEVASVRPNQTGSTSSRTNDDGGYWIATNITASSLIATAFDSAYFQLEGIPGWAQAERFDVRGKMPPGEKLDFVRLRAMIQALLADRFQLKFHHETRQQQVYALTLAKSGIKAKKSDPDEKQSAENNIGDIAADSNRHASLISDLAQTLQSRLGRIVLDETGLTDRYDLHLKWSPNPDQNTELPSLPTALEEQLGLKLVSKQGPVDIVVIERFEHPSDN